MASFAQNSPTSCHESQFGDIQARQNFGHAGHGVPLGHDFLHVPAFPGIDRAIAIFGDLRSTFGPNRLMLEANMLGGHEGESRFLHRGTLLQLEVLIELALDDRLDPLDAIHQLDGDSILQSRHRDHLDLVARVHPRRGIIARRHVGDPFRGSGNLFLAVVRHRLDDLDGLFLAVVNDFHLAIGFASLGVEELDDLANDPVGAEFRIQFDAFFIEQIDRVRIRVSGGGGGVRDQLRRRFIGGRLGGGILRLRSHFIGWGRDADLGDLRSFGDGRGLAHNRK